MTRRSLVVSAGLFAFLFLLVMVSGCAVEDIVKRAEASVSQAQSVHGDYLAPYEFASAEQYLAEAKKQLNESDYDTAAAFANKAIEMAGKATAIAQQKHAEPMIPWQSQQGGAQ